MPACLTCDVLAFLVFRGAEVVAGGFLVAFGADLRFRFFADASDCISSWSEELLSETASDGEDGALSSASSGAKSLSSSAPSPRPR